MITLFVMLRTPIIEIDGAIDQLTKNVIEAAKLTTPEIPVRSNREIIYLMEIRELFKKN